MIEIFQKPNRKPQKRTKARENYRILRQLERIPTRFKKYSDLSAEEKVRWKEQVRLSQLKRRQTDEKYRKLLSYRNKEYRQRCKGEAKTCSKCGKLKGYVAFNLHANGKTLRPECKECRKKYNKEYYVRRVHQSKGMEALNR